MNRAKKVATAICGMFAVGAGLIFGRAAVLADEFPPPDTELNDLPGDLPMGRYIEYIATDVSTNSVTLSNGVLVVGSEALNLFEMTNLTYEAAVRDAAAGTEEAIGSFSNDLAAVAFSGDYGDMTNKPQINGISLSGNKTGAQLNLQNALTAQQFANIAAVSDALAFDATHSYAAGDPVVYNGTLYTFTSAHTGAWTGSDVSAVDIIARLADKANRAPNPTVGNLAALDENGNPVDSGVAKSDVESLFFAQYYPEGNVKSAAEFTVGIKYDAPDTTNRTITVKPFCNTGDSDNDNSGLVGRVVIPPFVDSDGNGYIFDDGTRFKVVGVNDGSLSGNNGNLTSIVAPSTVTSIGDNAFLSCTVLASVTIPAATDIGDEAFDGCTALADVSLPSATTVGSVAFRDCDALASVFLPVATTIGEAAFLSCDVLASVTIPASTDIVDYAFDGCTALDSVDFGDTPRSSVPTLGTDAFFSVPTTCKIIVPYTQYDAWIAADGWRDLPQEFVRHAEKADKPTTFTEGNLVALDADGNPIDSFIAATNVALKTDISPTEPAFSNAVLAVGLGIDTNTVAAINELVDSTHSLPMTGATSVGALLLALAAAIAALKRGKADKSDVDPLLFAKYYPEGNVKSAAEFTPGIKYDDPDTTNRTITVKPFSNTGNSANDNSGLEGRVVLPPFVDGDGNGYISDDGTRYKVVGVSNGAPENFNRNLTAIITPTTVTSVNNFAFGSCLSLTSVSFPTVTSIGAEAFSECTSIVSVSLPSTTSISAAAFYGCTSLASVHLPAMTSTDEGAFYNCTSLASIDFGATPRASVPSLGSFAFANVPSSCKIIVPDAQYDAWTTASGWSDLVTQGYKFLRHSEWEYARKYEVDGKLDTASTGLLEFNASASYRAGVFVVYEGRVYKCTAAHTGVWNAAHFAEVELLFNHTQHGSDTTPLAIGASSSAGTNATALGGKTSAGQLGVAVGANDGSSATSAGVKGIAVGCGTTAGDRGISIGDKAKATAVGAIAIGGTRSGTDTSGAQATAPGACQIGYSATPNDTANSLRFRDTIMVNGQGKIPSANLDVEVALKSDLRYAMTSPAVTGTAVTLDDRACNYVDARALGPSDSLDIDFPAIVDGKSRDFVLAVECGANPPTISYAAFVTIMAEDASTLTPEEGMNIYAFTEFKTNMFIASHKLVATVVDNSPENADQLLLAMQKRGINTTGITNFGGVATALGLSDSATLQDAIDAVMN